MKPLLAIAVVLSFLWAAGCREHDRYLKPFGWEKTGNRSDSLLWLLDSCVYSYGDPDSLSRLADEYCAMSLAEDAEGIYRHRRLYWEGTALFMNGDFERGDSLRRMAMSVCDSSRFPRDYALYRMACEQSSDFPDNISRYNRYTEDLELFLATSDHASAFSRAVLLAGLMSEATHHGRARDYMLLADSLLGSAGLKDLQRANKVNVASSMFAAGDTVGAVEILRGMARDSDGERKTDPTVMAIINFNINQMTGDAASLRRAWEQVRRDNTLARMRPLVAAAVVRTAGAELSRDSLIALGRELEQSRQYAYPPADELMMASAMALVSASTEGRREYGEALADYISAGDKYYAELMRNEVAGADMNACISEVERRAAHERMVRTRLFWIIITVIVSIAAISGLLTMRYINRLRRVKLLKQLEFEQLERANIAAGLMLAEKERLTHQLQERIDALVADNTLRPESARNIATALAPENIDTDISDDEFMRRFIEKYPDVGRTGRRLALYIRQRKDTWEIAQAMNIRKESVLQARWRLRAGMRLPAESDLDTAILSV